MSNGNGGVSPEELEKNGVVLEDGAQLLRRLMDGYEAAPLHDEGYDLTNIGHVMRDAKNTLEKNFPEVVAQADQVKPEHTPQNIPSWTLS